ncbi:MAG: hypothetical protein FD189_1103 [Elusimicrobia bacterium]|nr:MAG: hypothetical protein FD189_1103 [Elusimicrobiota bacterium]
MATTADLSHAARELLDRSFWSQVGLDMPMTAMLLEERRVTTKGGLQLWYHLGKDDAEDEAQDYLPGDILTVGQAEFINTAKFNWKYIQVPMRYGIDVHLQNQLATSETKRRDLVSLLVERAEDGMKRRIEKRMHAVTAAGDTGAGLQGLPEAYDHSRTYGEITSNTTTVAYWNGASLADSYTDRATADPLSLDNLRKIKAIVKRYADKRDKLYVFLPEGLHSKLQGMCEGSAHYVAGTKENSLLKYGFDAFHVYGMEVVCDSYMTLNSMTDDMLVVNPKYWHFRVHPDRNLKVNEFFHQAKVAGGKDEWIAHAYLCAAAICFKPRTGMWKSALV